MANGQSLSGAAAGISAGEADIRESQTHLLNMAMGGVKLEEAQMQLGQQKRMLQLLNQQGSGLGRDPTADMFRLGEIYLESGMPEKAKEFYTAGSTMQHNASLIASNQLNMVIKDSTVMSSLLENVKDQESWQQANAMFQMMTGHPSPYAKMPYNPQAVDKLKMGIQSRKDRAITLMEQAREKDLREAAKEHEARIPEIRARTKLEDTRRTALEKSGAVGKVPKAASIKAITDHMIKEYNVQPEDARDRARPIAERMEELIRTQHLTASQAEHKAYDEAKEHGDLGGLRPRAVLAGSSPKRPLEIPASKTDMRPNKWYIIKGGPYAGKPGLWIDNKNDPSVAPHFVPYGQGPGEVSEGESEPPPVEGEDETADDEAEAQ